MERHDRWRPPSTELGLYMARLQRRSSRSWNRSEAFGKLTPKILVGGLRSPAVAALSQQ